MQKPFIVSALAIFCVSGCQTIETPEPTAPSAETSAVSNRPGPNKATKPVGKAPHRDLAKLSNASRPTFPFMGATIYADSINPLSGVASGDVYIDGRALRAKHPEFPESVTAGELQIDLVNEVILLKDWPDLRWPTARVRAKSPNTTIELTRTSYKVDGPASHSLDFSEGRPFE